MKAFRHEKRAPAAGGGTPIDKVRMPLLKGVGDQPVMIGKKPIKRTSAGLRDALFDAIEKVRDGDMVAEDAKAISGLAAQICNTVELEVQVAKLRTEYPSDAKMIIPSPLPLGTREQEDEHQ